MQKRLQEAQSLSGYLSKKSPAMLKGFQKRYFVIRDQGKLLIYYAKKPQSSELNPKGILPIADIANLANVKGSKTEFLIIMPERQFHLKAESESDRERWMENLQLLRDNVSKEESFIKTNKKQDWNDLNKDTMAVIKLEDEKEYYEKNSRKLDIDNDEVMKSKGIYPYVSKFDAATLDRFIICGFLQKKGKLAEVTRAKRRWFIMIASVPINGDEGQFVGPTQNDIPDTFSIDQIYYFAYDQRGDKSNFIGKLDIDEISDIEMMDLNQNQFLQTLKVQKLPYGFKFKHKERQYHFFADFITEVDRWIKAIKAVQARPKDMKLKIEGKAEENVIFEEQVDKKHQNKLLTGPLSWRQVMLNLKKNSLSWNGKDDDGGNQYVLLINIKEVVGKSKSFQVFFCPNHKVFTTDGQEYKFRAQSVEAKDKWVKSIKEQMSATKDQLDIPETGYELPPQEEYDKQIEQATKIESDDEESISDKFYKKMALNIEKNGGSSTKKKQSFSSKLFCCYGGGESDSENERGF